VITPYSAQVTALREHPALTDCEVATVNAFQGREKEVILCSWVRSNARGELGFVSDRRRLTVALTRARRLVVCVGDSATLCADDAFAEVVETMHDLDAYTTVWDDPVE
jgi:superfamily I DNA and/or RNA helicase